MGAGRGGPLRAIALTLVATIAAGSAHVETVTSVRAASGLDLLAMPSDAGLPTDRGLEVEDAPPRVDTAIDLGLLQDDAYRALDGLPVDEWEMRALAEALEFDPTRAFAFVRDRIAFEPYRGVLRGAAGTLAARAGNSFDRALLLKALLDAMAMPARFAFAELDDATAERLVTRAFEPPSDPLPTPGVGARAPFDVGALASRARRDNALLRDALGDRLLSVASTDDADALADARHHAWVQVALGPAWVDLDPSLPDALPGASVAPVASVAATLPEDETHRVTIAVEADVLDGGAVRTDTVLEETMDAWSAASSEVYLLFSPELEGISGGMAEALGSAGAFIPHLVVDGEMRSGDPFPVRPEVDPFTSEEMPGPRLARLRAIVTISVPGRADVRHTRTLVDRVPEPGADAGTALRPEDLAPVAEDAGGPLALQPLHHVLVSTGGMSPWVEAWRRAYLVDFAIELETSEPDFSEFALPDLLWPFAVANESLVLASERGIIPSLAGPGVAAYVAEPRVYVVSFAMDGATPPALRGYTDLLHDPVRMIVGPDAVEDAGPRARLWYGVLQTALETEYVRSIAAGSGPEARVRSASIAMDEPLTVYDPADSTLPVLRDAPGIRGALAAGDLVVVPGDPSTASYWWTVGPGGATRSVGPGGRGAGEFSNITRDITKRGPAAPRPEYVDSQGNRLVPKSPRAAPSRCPRNEYFFLVTCVSLPGAIALSVVGVVVFVVVLWGINWAWQGLIGRQ